MSALTLTRPTEPAVAEAIAAAGASGFSYDAVGCTREGSPGPGWVSDHERRVIGRGRSTYLAAVAALERWEQFDLDWVWPVRTDVPIEIDADFAFLSRSLGLWSLNICRVVYVERSADIDHERFGFAYGTLAMHSVRGEERFLVEWDRATDLVYFDIRKVSRPALLLLRLLGPVTRWVQSRFTRDAMDRMTAAVRP